MRLRHSGAGACPERSLAGMSLIEVVLAATILTVLARSLVESAESMGRLTHTGSVKTQLQIEGQGALDSFIEDLGRSAFRTVNGRSYPYVFDSAVADLPFDAHSHTLPVMEAESGDSDYGTLREIVFVLPADLDGDGRPDMDVDLNGTPELDGNKDGVRSEDPADLDGIWDPTENTIDEDTGVVWSHTEYSYVLLTRADGVNHLMRCVDGDTSTGRSVAIHVERVQVDTSATSQWSLGLEVVRLQVFFRTDDREGTLFRHKSEVVVTLRNG